MKNLFPTTILVVISLTSLTTTGCAGRAVARDSARRLANGVQLYEDQLDNFIKKQTIRSTNRQKEQQESRKLAAEGQLGTLRIANATETAEKMKADPTAEAQPSRLTAYLKDTHQKEADLNAKLQADQQQEAKDLQARLSALQDKKAILQRIRLNLAKLAAKTTLKDEADNLKDFIQKTKADFDDLNKQNQDSTAKAK